MGPAGGWFSPVNPFCSAKQTDCHRYNWNTVESGVKHQNPNPNPSVSNPMKHYKMNISL